MCGIIGVIGKKEKIPVRDYLGIMKEAISHRGPDDYGEHLGDNRGFANLRLSIVDVVGGKQPIYNDDKSVGIVYNGEIYNFEELRSDLKNKGYAFKTKTDTEVVLRAYEEYGTESFAKFNGMFGFCVWDDKKNLTYLVRDQIGIKPLYIYEDSHQLIFSSEIKGLLQVPGLNLELDPRGFEDYLTFRYVQAPYTFFKNIKRLEAGTYLKIKDGAASRYRYWDPEYDDIYPRPDVEKTKKELMRKIENSVKSQLMGEVPVGVLLSGGLDSSTIAYFVKKCGAKLKTFNIGFENLNEFEYSSLVAKNLGLEHIEISIKMDDILKDFDNVMFSLDEPIADPACLPLYILGRELKKHVTVVLSGEGGDELFGGYPQYRSSLENVQSYQERFGFFLDSSYYFRDAEKFLKNPKDTPPLTIRNKKYFEEQPLLNGMLAYDIKTWMPENLMMKADKILMAHSLEGRFPFLDKDIFEFSAKNIPQGYKINKEKGYDTKWILKESMGGLLPDEIIHRKKMGFSVPIDEILEKRKDSVLSTFDGIKDTAIASMLDTGKIVELVREYYAGKKENVWRVWTLYILSYWFTHVFPAHEAKRKKSAARINFDFEEDISTDTYIRNRMRGHKAPEKMEIRNKISRTYIKGEGLEIGAWYSPLWIPEGANVKYVDIIDVSEHKKRHPEIKFEFSKVDIIDDGEKLSKVAENSQDFIIANHFLEHTANILGTIRAHLSKLKDGGILYYAMPDKDFTFDKEREKTSFEHILKDDVEKKTIAHFGHYLEWAKYVDKVKGEKESEKHARNLMERDIRIHFHTWDADGLEELFLKAKKYFKNSFEIVRFDEIDNEVIILLRKNKH